MLRRLSVGPYAWLGWKDAVIALAECWVGAALPPECSRIATIFLELANEVTKRVDKRVTAWHVRLYAARNGRTSRTTPLYEILLLHAPQRYDLLPGRSHAYALILCPDRCAEAVDSAAAIEAAYGLPPARPSPPRTRWRRLLQKWARTQAPPRNAGAGIYWYPS